MTKDHKRSVRPASVAFVAPFPSRGSESEQTVGVEWYSESLVRHLRAGRFRIVAVAQRIESGRNPKTSVGLDIVRTWRRGLLFPVGILSSVLRYGCRLVHLQHEFFLYGKSCTAFEFLLLGLVLKVLGIRTIVTLHGVVPLSAVDPRFVREQGSRLSPRWIATAFRVLTRAIVASSEVIIVHEELHKRRLISEYFCPQRNIRVVPLGASVEAKGMSKVKAKESLGIEFKRIVLFFGYLAWYKGVERLLDAFLSVMARHPDTALVIAGGEHPRHKARPEYEAYLAGLMVKVARGDGRIIITGYVPDAKVPSYFFAADVVVFPHSVSLAASGPMSLAISYGSPFIASECFRETIEDDKLVFDHSTASLASRLEYALNDPDFVRRSTSVIERLRKERRWEAVAARTLQIYSEVLEQ